MKDLHNNVHIIRGVSPVAIGTTGTGKTSEIIDLQGFESCEAEFSYGAVTATNAVFTTLLKHGDVTGTLTSVADADLIGTEAAAGLAAAVRVDGSTEKVTTRLGYKGGKRYVQATVSSTITAGTPIGVNFIRGNPRSHPTTA